MSKGNNKKNFKATEKGFKEVDEEEEKVEKKETKKETPQGVKLENADNMDIPYPDLGGHTVSQLSQFQEHKRKSILGAKDAEFCKKYHL